MPATAPSIYLCHLVPPTIFIAAVLPHLWAGATGYIRVSTDWADMAVGRASGEVMVEGIAASGGRGERVARVATVRGDNAIIIMARRLPVNGLESVFELLRATELPLAEDGPENGNTTNRGSDSNEDRHDIARFRSGS